MPSHRKSYRPRTHRCGSMLCSAANNPQQVCFGDGELKLQHISLEKAEVLFMLQGLQNLHRVAIFGFGCAGVMCIAKALVCGLPGDGGHLLLVGK